MGKTIEIRDNLAATVAAARLACIHAALEAEGWDVPRAAQRLGTKRIYLYHLMREFGLRRPRGEQ